MANEIMHAHPSPPFVPIRQADALDNFDVSRHIFNAAVTPPPLLGQHQGGTDEGHAAQAQASWETQGT